MHIILKKSPQFHQNQAVLGGNDDKKGLVPNKKWELALFCENCTFKLHSSVNFGVIFGLKMTISLGRKKYKYKFAQFHQKQVVLSNDDEKSASSPLVVVCGMGGGRFGPPPSHDIKAPEGFFLV